MSGAWAAAGRATNTTSGGDFYGTVLRGREFRLTVPSAAAVAQGGELYQTAVMGLLDPIAVPEGALALAVATAHQGAAALFQKTVTGTARTWR